MELETIQNNRETISGTSFIEANTVKVDFDEIQNDHIIPVFSRDNEPLISQTDFIEIVQESIEINMSAVQKEYPNIRISHPIKGRIPEARSKRAAELLDNEKTIYYERMMFKIDVPSIYTEIDGQRVCLTIGGVKAYNLDALGRDSRSGQHFTVFCGFKNTVCSNLCVWSDGVLLNFQVKTVGELQEKINQLIREFEYEQNLQRFESWCNRHLTEAQFAKLLGRCRMYIALSKKQKADIYPLEITDSQMMQVTREYVESRDLTTSGMSLWEVYNHFTASIKSSYIDKYMTRSLNCTGLVEHIDKCLESPEQSWYLS